MCRWPELYISVLTYAPSYFRTKPLLQKVYQDGGLSHNNSATIAYREVAKLYSRKAEAALHISVGCGEFRSSVLDIKSCLFRLRNTLYTLLDPERQYRNMFDTRSAPEQANMLRLNPGLDLEDISLDDISSITRLERNACNVLDHSSNFLMIVQRAARRMVASLFYVTAVHSSASDMRIEITSRLRADEVIQLQKSYQNLHFRVEDQMIDFALPCFIHGVWGAKIDICVCLDECYVPISGSPYTKSSLDVRHEYILPLENIYRAVDTSINTSIAKRKASEIS